MRAIILAAGMGTRLKPLTEDIPKSLVKVNDEPMIERQIRFLKQKNISDIIIVTGYMKGKFEYLREKYSVKLIYNDKYSVYNNIYSMYLAKEYLEDTYVIDADIYMVKNYFETNLDKSSYFCGVKEDFENEWKVKFDSNNKVYKIDIGSGKDYIMSGISYWNKEDSKIIRGKLEEIIKEGNFEKLYWDNVVLSIIEELNIYVKMIDGNDWFEIDCLNDLNNAKKYLKTAKIV